MESGLLVSPLPRKRKNLQESYEQIPHPHTPTPPKRKRIQMPQNKPSNIADLADHLDRPQLIQILSQVADLDPQLKEMIIKMIPRPTMDWVCQLLLSLERKLSDSFPYSKQGPDRSDYSYNRVKPILIEIQETITKYLEYFVLPSSYPTNFTHEYPDSSFRYLHFVACLVHRLPMWENEDRNFETRELYQKIASFYQIAITEIARRTQQGKMFDSTMVNEWASNLHLHSVQLNGQYGFQDILDEFKKHLGWIIGL